MSPLEIVRQLAHMSHPYDEFKAQRHEPAMAAYTDQDDYADDLSSDRMEDDARALWRLIEEARTCLQPPPRPNPEQYLVTSYHIGWMR